MAYNPRPMPTIASLEELRQYVEEELRIIALAFRKPDDVDVLQFNVLHPIETAGPSATKIRDGMVLYADAATLPPPFNHSGIYARVEGAWREL